MRRAFSRFAIRVTVVAFILTVPWFQSLTAQAARAEEGDASHQHHHPVEMPADTKEVGLFEQLGHKIPLDLSFLDEEGNRRTLRELITGPTIIAPVYYNCPNVCNFLQGGLARVLPKLKLDAGEQYRVLSVSFNELETPRLAAESKNNYYAAMGKDYPRDAWHFLTGDLADIRRLTDSAGYYFKRQGEDFIHPVAIFVVSGDGTIVRYLTGTSFVPMDLNLALIEASEGRIGVTIRKVASFCFSFDPEKKTYVFNLLRVAATVTIVTAAAFLTFLIITGRKRRQR